MASPGRDAGPGGSDSDGMDLDVGCASTGAAADPPTPAKISATMGADGRTQPPSPSPGSVAGSSSSKHAKRGRSGLASGAEDRDAACALVPAQTAPVNAAKNKTPKITFLCEGCGKKKPLDEKVPGFQYDRDCKRARDALGKLARKQNQQEWWDATKKCPKQLKAVIKQYMSQCPGGCGRGKSRGFWSIATYKEKMQSESAVETRGQGQMMWKEQWVQWAGSVDGGFKTRAKATAEWDMWVNNKDAMITDMKGPEGEELRFRVVVKDLVDDVNTVRAIKELELTGKTVRKAGMEQIAHLRDSVMSGHDEVAGVQSVDYQGFAKALAINKDTSEEPFTSALFREGLNHIDLKATVMQGPPKAKAKEDKGAVATDAATGTEGSDVECEEDDQVDQLALGPPSKKRKKEKYYDAARQNTQSCTRLAESMNTMRAEAISVKTQIEQYLKMYSTGTDDAMRHYRPTLELLKSRLAGVELVLAEANDEGRKALAEYQATYRNSSLAAGLKKARKVDIAAAPPIQKFMNLKLIDDVLSMGSASYQACTSTAEQKMIAKSLSGTLEALRDLIGACKAAVADMQRAITGRAHALVCLFRLDSDSVCLLFWSEQCLCLTVCVFCLHCRGASVNVLDCLSLVCMAIAYWFSSVQCVVRFCFGLY
jgi:hypothetical protein